jgi:hypothetical protein
MGTDRKTDRRNDEVIIRFWQVCELVLKKEYPYMLRNFHFRYPVPKLKKLLTVKFCFTIPGCRAL